ncbi:MAG TPA: hypothetical protein VKK79_04930 [Candidatus Lokiarchaeia archaeon]|nr:hypothetical protein [Candidatus Lokiarchaeia archaeon]
MSQLALLGTVLVAPEQYRKMLEENSATGSLRGLIGGIWVLFAAYIGFFCYKGSFISFSGNSPFLPYATSINLLFVTGVGACLFLLWYAFDRAWLYGMFRQQGGVNLRVKPALIASYVPLVPLVGLWALLRVAFGGSYILWGVGWIPFITVSLTLAAHYVLLFYFTAAFVSAGGDSTQKLQQFHRQFGLWMAIAAGLIIGFLVGISFLISRSNPGQVMSRIF